MSRGSSSRLPLEALHVRPLGRRTAFPGESFASTLNFELHQPAAALGPCTMPLSLHVEASTALPWYGR